MVQLKKTLASALSEKVGKVNFGLVVTQNQPALVTSPVFLYQVKC